jgi:hypothetical protein
VIPSIVCEWSERDKGVRLFRETPATFFPLSITRSFLIAGVYSYRVVDIAAPVDVFRYW